jgi:hypothetical protein
MTIARAQLVDVSLARWCHGVTRCVRRAFLMSEGDLHREEWFDNQLEELADIFAIGVGGFSVMKNGEVSRKSRKTREEANGRCQAIGVDELK